eukprot:GFYU01006652.1.p1 GENE.GFYU01006652.1~~GFYU01006652.1.p1  ORF type:complete len:670 (-),score=143.64 GFYU01006652.1:102-1976(-)
MSEDLLELEHMIGFSGHHLNTLHYHPKEENTILYAVGAVVVIADLHDPHKQDFLRGHDEQISALVISPSGRFIASGQVGSTSSKENEAPIIVWDFASRREIYRLYGHTGVVNCLGFSPDDRFLSSSGFDERLCFWDMQNGEISNSAKCEKGATIVQWGPYTTDPRRPQRVSTYEMVAAFNCVVHLYLLKFDVKSMQYALTEENFQMPSHGLRRNFISALTTPQPRAEFLYAGTKEGEFVIFNVENRVFRHNFHVSHNGMTALAYDGKYVYAGHGDGKLKKLEGTDKYWTILDEIDVNGHIVSMSMAPNKQEMIVGTASGRVYRIRCSDLGVLVHSEGHVGGVRAVAFGKRSDLFASLDTDGDIRIWDLSDYKVLTSAHVQGAGAVCAIFTEEDTIISGWDDGSLRCHDARDGRVLWNKACAHRGRVTSICLTPQAILTGGDDASVRIWTRSTHELVSQFQDHQKNVTGLLADCTAANLVHSCSADRAIYTYDLKKDKRINYHLGGKEGSFTCMTQRLDNENEVITGQTDGRIIFWDCDYPDPVKIIVDPNRVKINAIEISPSGKYLITCSDDLSIKIWEVQSNQLIAVGVAHSNHVCDVKWSPDEKQIVSVGLDASVCVWNWYG